MKIAKVKDVKTPSRGTKKSAGIDFFVPNDFIEVILKPQQAILIPSGIKVDVPQGYALIAFNKSGIATKKQLIAGACISADTYIKTNKGLFKAIELTKDFIQKNEILIYSYNLESKNFEYKTFDGFRKSNISKSYKITLENNKTFIVSENHFILDENDNYVVISSIKDNYESISIKHANI